MNAIGDIPVGDSISLRVALGTLATAVSVGADPHETTASKIK
jgi:hypothetical protein